MAIEVDLEKVDVGMFPENPNMLRVGIVFTVPRGSHHDFQKVMMAAQQCGKLIVESGEVMNVGFGKEELAKDEVKGLW